MLEHSGISGETARAEGWGSKISIQRFGWEGLTSLSSFGPQIRLLQ